MRKSYEGHKFDALNALQIEKLFCRGSSILEVADAGVDRTVSEVWALFGGVLGR